MPSAQKGRARREGEGGLGALSTNPTWKKAHCQSNTQPPNRPRGRIIPCDFIGVVKSQQPVYLKGEVVNNHEELCLTFSHNQMPLLMGRLQNSCLMKMLRSTLSVIRHSLGIALLSVFFFHL